MTIHRFPWAEAMTLGLGQLRLTPDIFWRMTLPELAAAARALQPQHLVNAMKRADLTRLMQDYPDADERPLSTGNRQ